MLNIKIEQLEEDSIVIKFPIRGKHHCFEFGHAKELLQELKNKLYNLEKSVNYNFAQIFSTKKSKLPNIYFDKTLIIISADCETDFIKLTIPQLRKFCIILKSNLDKIEKIITMPSRIETANTLLEEWRTLEEIYNNSTDHF